jgi:hypothetical protein
MEVRRWVTQLASMYSNQLEALKGQLQALVAKVLHGLSNVGGL